MTSSLVGSEMCIRDRLRGLPYIWIHPFGPPQVIETDQEGGLISEEAKNCLLYTSDAADDM
eukprot:559279-Prorocentrum_lima.AAC.1